ncbi:MAG: DUF1559 family PulG-like putative transporter [Armatimonadota bacterium]
MTRCRGFTLIELLVVIAIVATLAAMLFPVFAQARAKGRQVTCASNMRNLGIAIHMYAQDYHETLPLTAYATGDHSFVAWHELLDPYVRNWQVWYCPDSQIEPMDDSGKRVSHFGYNSLYLTTMRLDFSNAVTHTAATLGQVTRPSETVALADSKASIPNSMYGDDGRYLLPPCQPDSHGWGRPNPLHNDGANICWVDGHLKWMRPQNFYAKSDDYFDLE